MKVFHRDGDSLKGLAGAVARKLTRPEVGAATIIETWQKDLHDVNELAAELARQVDAVNSGDLARAEGMLIAQAHSLDAIFVHLARQAVGTSTLQQWEAYMRMAMKAQNQCRMTLESLAAIKYPPVVFARQANINNGGQQQVNNGAAAGPAPTQAGAANSPAEQIGLLGASNGQRLDTGTTGAAVGPDPHLAPLGAVNRPAQR